MNMNLIHGVPMLLHRGLGKSLRDSVFLSSSGAKESDKYAPKDRLSAGNQKNFMRTEARGLNKGERRAKAGRSGKGASNQPGRGE